MQHEIVIKDIEALAGAAAEFVPVVGERPLIAFHAPMGAGKTTFIKAVCEALGVRSDAVSSPTFAIVNEYHDGGGSPLFHFDFYRIARPAEALDIGLYDYLDSGSPCLMEWPENVEGLLPEQTLAVSISVLPDGSRRVSWED